MLDYKHDVGINPNEIERELINQPLLYMKYAELHAKAVRKKDSLKQKIELLYAELDSTVRLKWQVYFEIKPTEIQIKKWICNEQRYIKLNTEYMDACYSCNVLAAAKEAMAHKRFILGNIVSMKIGGIFANPKVERRNTGVSSPFKKSK